MQARVKARLAYFILAHRHPEQLRLLVETIADPRDFVILHVDLKSRLGLRADRNGTWAMARRLARTYPNVHLLRSRFTNWGGWSLCQVMLDAIDRALALDAGWTHLVNLSGQCFPIKPLDSIRAGIGAAGDAAFVELRHFSSLPADDWHLRWNPMIELPHRAVRLRGPRRRPDGFELDYKGSQWCILPRAFCAWQREAPVAQEIRRYLSGLFLSDELLMQTLVRNGPWRERVAPHFGREIVWPGPRVMTMADWDDLQRSPAFYARKFDPSVDDRIAPALARAIAGADGRCVSAPRGEERRTTLPQVA
ncbi:MAG: hypothetical protein KGL52_05265 [Rhodospirillales bacterium]|nr:hypothetical protein [Rhodospirillales bacterium]